MRGGGEGSEGSDERAQAPFTSAKPIYLQIVDRLCRRIARGDLALGERLPSVRDSALAHGVNPNTMQRVHEVLERLGVTETRRGQGTFVTPAPAKIRALRSRLLREAVAAFGEDMVRLGVPKREVLHALEQWWATSAGQGAERGSAP